MELSPEVTFMVEMKDVDIYNEHGLVNLDHKHLPRVTIKNTKTHRMGSLICSVCGILITPP